MSGSTRVSTWLDDHPTVTTILSGAIGGLAMFLWLAVMKLAKPWLPAWLMPTVVLTVGIALLVQRLRRPVPQGQPEKLLFFGLAAIVVGAWSLIDLL